MTSTSLTPRHIKTWATPWREQCKSRYICRMHPLEMRSKMNDCKLNYLLENVWSYKHTYGNCEVFISVAVYEIIAADMCVAHQVSGRWDGRVCPADLAHSMAEAWVDLQVRGARTELSLIFLGFRRCPVASVSAQVVWFKGIARQQATPQLPFSCVTLSIHYLCKTCAP